MKRMGLSVTILNKLEHKKIFEKSYPDIELPIIYVKSDLEIHDHALNFNVVIATANHSVEWIASLENISNPPLMGYYIQDFEPNFYPINSDGYSRALNSYSLVSSIQPFTKTEWNRYAVLTRTGCNPKIIGPSVDVDIFAPRQKCRDEKKSSIHVVSMVRPSSPRRNPEGTIEIRARLKYKFGDQIKVSIFGAEQDGPTIPQSDLAHSFNNYGVLNQKQVADLLGLSDIFIDMSHYQAMGLTGLEAMASGAVPVLPIAGGASDFAENNVNALLVDTSKLDDVFDSICSILVSLLSEKTMLIGKDLMCVV
jgi:glycosyltransferase involved in cell wall biosynthesis